MIEVKRKNGESIESLLRRFGRRIQQSKVLLKAKDMMFYKKPRTKREQKEYALRRKEIQKEKEYLKKLGRFDELEKKFKK